MTSMINNYIERYKSRRPKQQTMKTQDELRTHIKAYKPLGSIVEADSFLTKDINSAKYFLNGIQGKGNDYSIGRINDLSIKLGGLGIATILATSKGTPLKKGMEFVGLFSWLGAMSLWPKLAINKPIKMLKGVDLDMEYKTSQGHKKKFYQDPQFICWDMISDEEIHKMGDKMGVPQNIKNRRKAIENKARQIAIQGNTLSLLTAGIATPLIASLVSDQIDKRILSSSISSLKENVADGLVTSMTNNKGNYKLNTDAISYIRENVTQNTTNEAKVKIKELLTTNLQDTTLKKDIETTVDTIFKDSTVSKTDVVLDDKFTDELLNIIRKDGKFPESRISVLQELNKKYAKLDKNNIGIYLDEIETKLNKNSRIDLETIRKSVIPNIENFINSSQTSIIPFQKKIQSDLMQLSTMLDIYDQKVFNEYSQRFFKVISKSENSVDSKTWKQMYSDIAKTLNISTKNLEIIVNDMNVSAPDAKDFKQTEKVMCDIFDEIVRSPEKYTKTMKKLAIIAEKISLRNEKYLKFSLDYLDYMYNSINIADQTGNLQEFSQRLKMLIGLQRQKVIINYINCDAAAFMPISALNSLQQTRKVLGLISDKKNLNKKELYEAMKKLIVTGHSTEHYINKLDIISNIVKTADDYKLFSNLALTDLSPEVKKLLPEEFAAKLNANLKLQRQLLVNLSDGNKLAYLAPNNADTIEALNTLKIYKYADEIFNIDFKNVDDIIKTMGIVAQKDKNKLKTLKNFLKLSDVDINQIKSGDFNSLFAACKGSADKGKGFLENGRYKLAEILNFLNISSLNEFGDINVITSKTCRTAKIVSQDMLSYVRTNAKEQLNYNRWFKRVGGTFLALCGVTAIAISQIGKKNEFNPDIYKERKSV